MLLCVRIIIIHQIRVSRLSFLPEVNLETCRMLFYITGYNCADGSITSLIPFKATRLLLGTWNMRAIRRCKTSGILGVASVISQQNGLLGWILLLRLL